MWKENHVNKQGEKIQSSKNNQNKKGKHVNCQICHCQFFEVSLLNVAINYKYNFNKGRCIKSEELEARPKI